MGKIWRKDFVIGDDAGKCFLRVRASEKIALAQEVNRQLLGMEKQVFPHITGLMK